MMASKVLWKAMRKYEPYVHSKVACMIEVVTMMPGATKVR